MTDEAPKGGPQPPPATRSLARRRAAHPVPTAHVVPTVSSIVADTMTLIKGEIDSIKARSRTRMGRDGNALGMTLEEARTLETLLKTLKVASDTGGELKAMVREALAGVDEATISKLLGVVDTHPRKW